jgi:hypothetical protein
MTSTSSARQRTRSDIAICTRAIGKWHLDMPPGFGPQKSGYDQFWGIRSGSVAYYSHQNSRGSARSVGWRSGGRADRLLDRSARRSGRHRDQPLRPGRSTLPVKTAVAAAGQARQTKLLAVAGHVRQCRTITPVAAGQGPCHRSGIGTLRPYSRMVAVRAAPVARHANE